MSNEIFEKKYIFEGEYLIPYKIVENKINNNLYRKYYLFDIRSMDVTALFNNFELFQSKLLEDDYYSIEYMSSIEKNIPCGFTIWFIFDENTRGLDKSVLRDMKWALKQFITYDEYLDILSTDIDRTIISRGKWFTFNNREIFFDNFNLLYGFNGSGKSLMLKKLSKVLNQKIYYANRDIVTNEILNSGSAYLENILKLIDINKGMPLLLDDVCWNALDYYNRIKVLDMLYEYSHNDDVYVTSSTESVVNTVRKRVHNPNIINLNK